MCVPLTISWGRFGRWTVRVSKLRDTVRPVTKPKQPPDPNGQRAKRKKAVTGSRTVLYAMQQARFLGRED
jgi:hypothetical protein